MMSVGLSSLVVSGGIEDDAYESTTWVPLLCWTDEECDHASENPLSNAITNDYEQDMSISDSESGNTSFFPRKFGLLKDELIGLEEDDRNHMLVKQGFLSGMGDLRDCTTVKARYGNSHSCLLGKARVQAFQIYIDTMVTKIWS